VVALAVWGLAMGVARLLPTKYESTALVEVSSPAGTPSSGSDAVALEMRNVIFDRVRLEEGPDDPDDVISVSAETERTFSLSFRAATAEGARRACAKLADAVVAHFGTGSNSAAREDLQRHTKALADFVSAHPDVFGEAASPPASAAPKNERPGPPASDPALIVLRQEKARLEAELSKAEGEASAPHEANPYDDAAERPKIAEIGKRLAEVRLAIIAHQNATARRASSAPPAGSPVVTPVPPSKLALQAERQRLVQAVIEAEGVSASAPARQARSARVVRPPTLPDSPVKPSRWLVRIVPLALGAWCGLLWAVGRVVYRQSRAQQARLRRASIRPRPAASPPPPPITERVPREALLALPDPFVNPPLLPASSLAAEAERTQASSLPDVEPKGPYAVPNAGALGSHHRRAETMLGMMDPALTRTQIGGTPENLLSRGEASEKVDGVPKARGTSIGKEPVQGEGPRPSSDPPPEDVRNVSTTPPRRDSLPPLAPRFARERAASSNPPRPEPRPSSQAPRPTADRPSSPPPRGDDAPPMKAPGVDGRERRDPAAATLASPGEGVFGGPVTRRFGSGDPNSPKTLSPPPPPPSVPPRPERPATSYSFVDQSRRNSRSPGPRSNPPAARRSNAPEAFDDTAPASVQPSPQALKGNGKPRQGSMRPVAERAAIEKTDALQAVPARLPAGQEVWKRVIDAPSDSDEIIAPRSLPSSWRIQPGLERGGNGREILAALCDQVRKHSEGQCFVVAVVGEYSVLEAKSVVSARLSAMLSSDGGKRVLLMEANFDFPAVHRVLSIEMPHSEGFSQQLRARRRATSHTPWKVVRCSDALHVLAEGVVRSPGILLSREFADAIAELRGSYDVIVVDGPIAGLGVETKPLDAVTDGIAVVARTGSQPADVLDRARGWFGRKELFAAVPADAGTL
jgi:Mrp family chromosome partitioning ATPase